MFSSGFEHLFQKYRDERLVTGLLEEVLEVPGAVANVQLWVREVADAERRAAGADRDAACRRRRELHQPDGTRLRVRRRVELRLLVDHGREERRVEVVVVRVRTDDRRVVERIAQPFV